MKEKKIFSVEGLVREYYLKLTDTKASPRLEARKMVFLESCLKDEYSSYFNIRNCVSSVWTIPLQGYIHRTSFSLFALSPRKNFKSAASESYWWFIICTQGITLHCEDIYENINHSINFCLLGIAFAPSRINRSPLWTIRAFFFNLTDVWSMYLDCSPLSLIAKNFRQILVLVAQGVTVYIPHSNFPWGLHNVISLSYHCYTFRDFHLLHSTLSL